VSVNLSDCPTCGQVGCSEAPDHKTELADICFCADWRDEHRNDGACRLNGLGHGGAPECEQFRFARTARRLKHTHEEVS
jgi:hypothetical protein